MELKYVQDVYGTDINKQWPGSDIILAFYWMRPKEVPLGAVHIMVVQSIYS
jgi:hypothetical protein